VPASLKATGELKVFRRGSRLASYSRDDCDPGRIATEHVASFF
jgi:hypothetical protein